MRSWPRAEVARAFGPSVEALEVAEERGTWVLRVRSLGKWRAWRYDDAHRRLAEVLGWDALPSPAERVEPAADGWRATGVGRGHRVGLCLGAP